MLNYRMTLNPPHNSLTVHLVRFAVIASLCLGLKVLSAEEKTSEFAESLWTPDSANRLCGGSYDISRLLQISSDLPDKRTMKAFADVAILGPNSTSELTGNVEINYNDLYLITPNIRFDVDADLFQAPEGMTVISEDFAVFVQETYVEVQAKEFDAQGADFVLFEDGYRGQAKSLTANQNQANFEGVSITYCPPHKNSWLLEAGTLRLNRESNIAVARNVKLNFGDFLPALHLPYIRFPLTRSRTSGVLPPTFESNSLRGYELGIPIYINLAPNYDLTVTPRLSSIQSHSVEVEFRHLSNISTSELSSTWLPTDQDYLEYLNSRIDRNQNEQHQSSQRWFLSIQHGLGSRKWIADIDYSFVSDADFLRDFGNSIDDLGRVGLSRTAMASRITKNYEVSASSERYEPFRFWGSSVSKVPEFRYSHRFPIFQAHGGYNIEWAKLKHTDDTAVRKSERRHVDLIVDLPRERAWGHFNLSAARSLTRFETKVETSVRHSTTYRLDTELIFERSLTRDLASLGVVKPRFVYIHRDVKNPYVPLVLDYGIRAITLESVLDPTREIRLDHVTPVESMGIALDASLVGASNHQDLLNTQLVAAQSSTDYFKDLLTGVAISGKLSDTLSWSLASFRLKEPFPKKANEFRIHFRHGSTKLVAWVRQEKDPDVLQTYLDVSIPVATGWTVYSRWNHDWEHDTHLDSYLGFEHQGCCMEYRLLWRRVIRYAWVETEKVRSRTGIFFELSMKGLTSIGDNVVSIVDRPISSNILLY